MKMRQMKEKQNLLHKVGTYNPSVTIYIFIILLLVITLPIFSFLAAAVNVSSNVKRLHIKNPHNVISFYKNSATSTVKAYVFYSNTKPTSHQYDFPSEEYQAFNVSFHINVSISEKNLWKMEAAEIEEAYDNFTHTLGLGNIVKWPGGTLTWVIYSYPNSTGILRIIWPFGFNEDCNRQLTPEKLQYLNPGEITCRQFVFLEDEENKLIIKDPNSDAIPSYYASVYLDLNATLAAYNQTQTSNSNNNTAKFFVVDGWAAFYRKEGTRPLIVLPAAWLEDNPVTSILVEALVVMFPSFLLFYRRKSIKSPKEE